MTYTDAREWVASPVQVLLHFGTESSRTHISHHLGKMFLFQIDYSSNQLINILLPLTWQNKSS